MRKIFQDLSSQIITGIILGSVLLAIIFGCYGLYYRNQINAIRKTLDKTEQELSGRKNTYDQLEILRTSDEKINSYRLQRDATQSGFNDKISELKSQYNEVFSGVVNGTGYGFLINKYR